MIFFCFSLSYCSYRRVLYISGYSLSRGSTSTKIHDFLSLLKANSSIYIPNEDFSVCFNFVEFTSGSYFSCHQRLQRHRQILRHKFWMYLAQTHHELCCCTASLRLALRKILSIIICSIFDILLLSLLLIHQI